MRRFGEEVALIKRRRSDLDGYVEEWMALCKQAAEEQDPGRLLSLVTRINSLLDLKHKRLQSTEIPPAREESAL